jgi:hypothetical protein
LVLGVRWVVLGVRWVHRSVAAACVPGLMGSGGNLCREAPTL